MEMPKGRLSGPRTPVSLKINHNTSAKTKTIFINAGFVNKGNTCYANVILQALSTIPSLWSQSASPIMRAIALKMTMLNRSLTPVDPSNFLKALERKIHSYGNTTFHYNSQQDVAEMLLLVFDELKGYSVIASQNISTEVSVSVSCNTCLCSSVTVENQDILTLSPSSSVQLSGSIFLTSENLENENKWFCPQCSLHQESTRETRITRNSEILTLHLKRFARAGL
ncbi:uncharacterized protein LOC130630050 [Hydractinia symbiolongicarpus]|uniref:uncharacterized protein LOC130630050 n=1 Tax=Hydractinia symbiolongicarpus TaxID=13093 RepID=UPI00254E8F0E|nr:uncharacterized protein LOC130630050 [Hydractinia symbiolongicarpus]